MNIIFERIIGHNFLSISDCDLVLSNNGYVIVDGVNNYLPDLAKSNGAGKSSIFEMIVWALTGETIRGIKSSSIVNINGADGAFVDLYVKIDGNSWRLLRSKDHKEYKTNFRIWKNDEELSGKGIKDTTKLFEEYFPDLTLSLIGSVMVLGQGLPQRFSNNTPSGRKEILERLSKSDYMIGDLKDRVKNRLDSLNKEIRGVEDSLLQTNTKLSMQKKRLEEDSNYLSSLEDISKLKEEFNNKEALLSAAKLEKDNILAKIDANDQEIHKLNSELSAASDKYTENLRLNTSQKDEELSQLNEDGNNTITNLSMENSSLLTQITHISNEIKRLKSIVDICPTCGQKLIGVEKPDTSELEEELKELQDKQLAISQTLSLKNNERNKDIEAVKTKYAKKAKEYKEEFDTSSAKLNSAISKLNELRIQFKESLTDKNRQIEFLEKFIQNINTKITKRDTEKDYLEQSIKATKETISKLEQNVLYISNSKDNLSNRLNIVSKFNTSLTRDFRGVLLSSLIDYINKKAKAYSLFIFDTSNIEFELDGNNISISYNGKQYESLSGGEKQKVDLIVQFSIRDMLCRFLDFSCNILVLDEIFDNLDSIGCNKVINLISTLLSDIDSIYIVTHHEELEIPNDIRWVITKNESGVSNVSAAL